MSSDAATALAQNQRMLINDALVIIMHLVTITTLKGRAKGRGFLPRHLITSSSKCWDGRSGEEGCRLFPVAVPSGEGGLVLGVQGRSLAPLRRGSPGPKAWRLAAVGQPHPWATGTGEECLPLSQARRKSFSSSVVSSFTCLTSFSASSLLGEAEAEGSALW